MYLRYKFENNVGFHTSLYPCFQCPGPSRCLSDHSASPSSWLGCRGWTRSLAPIFLPVHEPSCIAIRFLRSPWPVGRTHRPNYTGACLLVLWFFPIPQGVVEIHFAPNTVPFPTVSSRPYDYKQTTVVRWFRTHDINNTSRFDYRALTVFSTNRTRPTDLISVLSSPRPFSTKCPWFQLAFVTSTRRICVVAVLLNLARRCSTGTARWSTVSLLPPTRRLVSPLGPRTNCDRSGNIHRQQSHC